MYSRSAYGGRRPRPSVPPPYYGGTAIRSRAETNDESFTRTRIHSYGESGGYKNDNNDDNRINIPSAPEPGPDCESAAVCADKPGCRPAEVRPAEVKRTEVRPADCERNADCERTDDILLAGLIALLFGTRSDDGLLLMLVLLYVLG